MAFVIYINFLFPVVYNIMVGQLQTKSLLVNCLKKATTQFSVYIHSTSDNSVYSLRIFLAMYHTAMLLSCQTISS